jgi:ribosomal protein S18 acetylase RimI-like enzyme
MEFVSADHFSLEQLAEAYNHTRVDYIVPMPMNVARLREYIRFYDIDLAASCVAVSGSTIFGLGMLGIRSERGWITRVGVLPHGRRKGTGRAIIERLMLFAGERELGVVWLEVIKGNDPAYQLFQTGGFEEARELVVARRPPDLTYEHPDREWSVLDNANVSPLGRAEALALLAKRTERPNWLNETESMQNADDLCGIFLELDSGKGWVSYQFDELRITHIVFEVIEGDRASVATAVALALHERHPTQDAILENIPASDPMWNGLEKAGYFDTFRRLEMIKSV